ncbi:hypothetical protein F5B21DRAFT_518411 [Xylaria acuta]|nr:hypothetical protein F5B21DRAFT_518411 [Xylaria acuta]
MTSYELIKQETDSDEPVSDPVGLMTDEDGYTTLNRNHFTSRFWRWPVAEAALVLLVLPDKILVPFDHDWLNLTDEGIGGVRYADDKWKDMIPPGGGSYGLAPSARSTQQEGQMHYLVAGYHQLHCLSRNHVLHCVEAIRQALHCFLDPTPINLEAEWPHVPNGQKHVCRNRGALASWAAAHRSGMPGEEDWKSI